MLAACIFEMRRALMGQIVHQVRQPADLDIVLVCRESGRQSDVFLSADARYARAHLSSIRHSVPKTPPAFCQLLRKHLEGRRVTAIDQAGLDRILRITFEGVDGESRILMHEIMGRHSNIILLSGSEKILGAAKIVGRKVSRARQIIPGSDYDLPPVSKPDLRSLDTPEFDRLLQESIGESRDVEAISKWLVANFSGFSPILAREVISLAGVCDASSIRSTALDILRLRETGSFSPVVIHTPGSAVEQVYPIPLTHLTDTKQHARSGISEILESTARFEIETARIEDARSESLRALEKSLQALREEASELSSIASNPNAGESLRQKAEILAGNYHEVVRGGESVTLPDFYDPEMKPITIQLKPELSAEENIQRYFKQARKADDRVKSAIERLPQIDRDIATLTNARDQIVASQSVEEIKQRRQALENARLIRQVQSVSSPHHDDRPFGGFRIKLVTSPDGIDILYGETAEANDYLTTKLAGPNDVWLHARSVTGAHVIVRTAGYKSVPPGTLKHAAEIAARHSDAKHSSYVAVDWTYRKFVRKPRKSPPGLVTYSNEKTIHVTRGK